MYSMRKFYVNTTFLYWHRLYSFLKVDEFVLILFYRFIVYIHNYICGTFKFAFNMQAKCTGTWQI